MIRKIQDTFNDGISDADLAFSVNEKRSFYKLFRTNVGALPKNFAQNSENSTVTTREFSLRGIQFGNWLTTEDKYNYLSAFWIAMHDLNGVLKFKNNNLGVNKCLGVCFGSRGVGGSKAHYSPKNHVMNLNRYHEGGSLNKTAMFLHTGGAGSLAHEYGHFLDGIFGQAIEPEKGSFWLTQKCSYTKKYVANPYQAVKEPLRFQMCQIFNKLLWVESKGKMIPSKYATGLNEIPGDQGGDYYRKRVEIWARLFESYISYKLNQKGLHNTFLTKKPSHFVAPVYVNHSEMKKLEKDIDKLIMIMRSRS